MKKKKIFFLIIIIILIFSIILISLRTPSNNRNWSEDQKTLSYAKVNDNLVEIYNIRNFTYRTTKDYTISYYNKTYDINKLKGLYYIVEPFSTFEGLAHTFLSFEFENNTYLSISVEIRKEKNESFSPIKGLFRNFELSYVIGDEKDLIKLRTNYRNDSVYLYPIKISKKSLQLLFLDMINRTNNLKENPEFYNTITNTCTTNILDHVKNIAPDKLKYSYSVLFPGYSGELIYNADLINTTQTFEEAKQYYNINELALTNANSKNFSINIRKDIN